jgi:MFS family permease
MTDEGKDGARSGVLAPAYRATSIGLFLVITLVGFEAMAIATVMPRVSRELHGLRLYGWVFSAFLLAQLLGIIIAGRLADRYGPARPFVAGLGLFAVGLVIGGLTPSMPVLVVGRAVQGFGAGVIPAVLYVVIGRAYPSALQPRMFALMSTAWVLPSLFGPPVAVVIASTLGWRWVFLALLPIVLLAGALAAPSMRHLTPVPSDPDAEPPASTSDAVQVTLGAGLLLGGLTAERWYLLVPLVVIGLVVGLRAFIRLTPVGTLRARRGTPAAVLVRGMLTFAFFGTDAYVTLAVHDVRGGSIALGGVALAAGGIMWTAASWIQQHYIHRVGAPRLVRIGFVGVAIAVALFSVALIPSVPIGMFVLAWAVSGFGTGLSYAPIAVVVLDAAEPGREGRSSASIQLSDVLGCAIGIGVGGALVAFGEHTGWDPASGLHINAGLDVVVALGGAVLASRLRTPNRSTAAAVPQPTA